MSGLSESSELEENDTLMSNISQDLLNSGVFSPRGTLLEPSVQCPQETMELLCDQGDLLTSVGFMDSICSDGPPKAAYVNGSTSPHISDEVLLDISKNVPGFLPKSLNAQNSVTANVHFDGHDPLRKEGEITIRQTLTAEDVENRGIWGFDTESPESSLDNYNDTNDLSWNPQKEFMKFLWDDENALEMEEKLHPVPSPINHKIIVPSPLVHRKRKRKAEMVLKVDPSMDLYPNLDFDSKIDHQGEGSQADCSPIKKIRSPRKPSKPRSPIVKTNKYLNGGGEAIKHPSPKPAKKPDSKTQKLGLIIENLPMDSGAKEKPRKNSFKEKPLEHTQIMFNTDTPSLKPFICKDCGQCFHDRGALLHHIDVHKAKHPKTKKERNEFHEMKDEGKNATLQCPQCTFGTNCPNTFVQHAKTHEKDKRYYSCNKCDFVEMNEFQMRSHLLHKHSERDADLTVWKSDGFQTRKVNKANKNATTPSPISNSFKRKTKNFLGNHVDTSCLQKFHEDQKAFHSLDISNEVLTTRAQLPSRSPKLSVKLQTSDKKESRLTNGKCSQLQKDKKLRKARVNSKRIQRLDKSVHTVLSRKKHQSAYKCSSFQNLDEISEIGFLDRDKYHYNDSLECETATSGTERTSPSSNCVKKYFCSKEGITKSTSKSDGNVSCSESIGNCDSYKGSPPNSIHLKKQTLKSPSKRKMSTPFHNMQGQDILLDFPKCRQNLKKQETSKDEEYSSNDDLMDDSGHTVGSCLNKEWEDKDDQCALKSSAKGDQSSSRMFSVKEEHKDEEVYNAGPESISAVKRESCSDLETDLKACPYCPAVFESGISLSNHIRGHLYRVGQSARKAASVSKLADKVPPVRRQKVPQIKTEVDTSKTDQQTEMPTDCQQTELVCPLCREWFDNRTGLSNHVRGHLKRLGKPTSTASKSPVVILKELMRDKKQFQLKLQVLERKCRGSRIYQPVRLSNGLTFSSTVKQHKYIHSRSVEEKKRIETNKGSPPSDLIGILKKRRAHEETKAKCPSHTARKALSISSSRERGLEIQPFKAVPNSLADKSEVGRKVCLHCNATFHSGVSLSNHMRAYAHRKKKGLSDGSTYDCKQRKQRSRSGSKKKTFPLLHAPEEIYRLKCRFCDLVFQGPLSVQEDWIKHLQRHIMNTAVPRTGAGMVEVTTVPTNSCSNSEPQAQPSVMQTSSLAQEL
ncbi:zinc finger protein 644a [Triplophysa dalaica]|uniref:zinc finger protein 644a n=1 Tax=Triplophysa dalaica TaxID=1582913 RepID=UPI0024DF6429|nr:zinc finger protein 644a [Triplophysa dalaica]